VQIHLQDGRTVCERCDDAASPFARLKGLLGRRTLGADEGIYLRPASSVHTFFMRFPIDAVFVDGEGRVLKVAAGLRPWRAAGCRGARAVLELSSGESERRGVRPGDQLVLV
jgi:uncharacterized membrane protein (UPF0127 family)